MGVPRIDQPLPPPELPLKPLEVVTISTKYSGKRVANQNKGRVPCELSVKEQTAIERALAANAVEPSTLDQAKREV